MRDLARGDFQDLDLRQLTDRRGVDDTLAIRRPAERVEQDFRRHDQARGATVRADEPDAAAASLVRDEGDLRTVGRVGRTVVHCVPCRQRDGIREICAGPPDVPASPSSRTEHDAGAVR